MNKTLLFICSLTLIFSAFRPHVKVIETSEQTSPQSATLAGMIAFVQQGDLWAAAPDSSQLRRLTDSDGVADPEWASDGHRIAYIRNFTIAGTSTKASEIRVYDFTTNQSIVVLPAKKTDFILLGSYYAYHYPRWSLDQSSLYYIASDGRVQGDIVHKVNVSTGANDQSFTPFFARSLDISPIDGRIVYGDFSNGQPAGQFLRLASATGQQLSILIPLVEGQGIGEPRWSSDGSRIGFFASGGIFGLISLVTIRPNGTDRQLFTPTGTKDKPRIDWSLDDASIIYEAGSNLRIFKLADHSEMAIFPGSSPSWGLGYKVIISHIEVTQAIQNTTNGVPLIAGKPTFVRIYADCRTGCTSISGVTATLQISSSAGTKSLTSNSKTVYHPNSWQDQRSDYSKTFNFSVPVNLVTGDVTLKATIGDESSSETYPFQPARNLRIAYVPIHYDPFPLCIWTGAKDPNASRIATAESWALKVFPTSNIEYIPWPTMNWGIPLQQGLGCREGWDDEGVNQLQFSLTLERALNESDNRPEYVFGWLPQDALPGGSSDPTWLQGIGVAAIGNDDPDGRRIFAHEVAHLMGRRHTNTVDNLNYPLICSLNNDPKPPHYGGTNDQWRAVVDLNSDWINHPGLPDPPPFNNSFIQEWGLDLLPKNPGNTYDYLSYCGSIAGGNVWTSSWTYSQLFSQTLRTPTTATAVSPLPALQSYFFTNGLVYKNDTATLNPIWVIPTTVPTQNPPLGTQYCLEAQDSFGVSLISQCFDLDFINYESGDVTDVDSFSIMLPYPANTARVVLKKGELELAFRTVSANAPIVTITSPIAGESWAASGTQTITWNASDNDDDPLTYSVLFSPDGIEWTPIGTALTQTQTNVDAAEIPGGNSAQVRVMASDGVNTTTANSSQFSVGSKGPQVFILSPEEDRKIFPGDGIFLQGYAYDPEDGTLGESSLQWSSNRDGSLGTGSTVLTNLSWGPHIITLFASDSNGNIATVSINVSGGNKVHLPLISR